jgi:hypothetical protein
MSKATSALIAAVALVALTGGAYAQSNNTLATPTTQSPAKATSGYGTPGVTESGAGSSSAQRNSADTGSTPMTPAYGVNNTLARPSTKSPAAQ